MSPSSTSTTTSTIRIIVHPSEHYFETVVVRDSGRYRNKYKPTRFGGMCHWGRTGGDELDTSLWGVGGGSSSSNRKGTRIHTAIHKQQRENTQRNIIQHETPMCHQRKPRKSPEALVWWWIVVVGLAMYFRPKLRYYWEAGSSGCA